MCSVLSKPSPQQNVFIYLNDRWDERYGGDLELWSASNASRGTSTPRPGQMISRHGESLSLSSLTLCIPICAFCWLVPPPHSTPSSPPSAAPLWNRLFVFATGDHTFHGHPMPLNTSRRNRRSVAMYYYTNGQPQTEQHMGAAVPMEQGSLMRTCSAMPLHHQSTAFAACDDFRAVDAHRCAARPPRLPPKDIRGSEGL